MSDWLSDFEQKRLETGKRKSEVEVLSSSYMKLDEALGINGFPRGKVIDIAGPAGVGKTALVLDFVAEAQRNNLVCVYLDLQRDFDSQFAHNRKVDIQDLLIFRPKDIQSVALACEALMKEGLADFIIFDSISAVDTTEVSLKEMINPIRRHLLEYQSSIIMLSQVREDLSQGGQTTPHMRDLDEIANVRMMMKSLHGIKHEDVLIGKEVEIDIYKNDLATPAKAVIEIYI